VAFFYYVDHGCGTDPQHASGVANATPVDGHVDHLAAHLRHAAAIVVLEKKNPPRASAIVTLKALGAGGLLARLDDFSAVTVGTLDGNVSHPCPPHTMIRPSHCTGKLLI
jgi:hypothetical protein